MIHKLDTSGTATDTEIDEELQKYENYDFIQHIYYDKNGKHNIDIKILVAKAIKDGTKQFEDKLDRLVSIKYHGPSETPLSEQWAYNFPAGEAHYFVFKFRREHYEKP